MALGSVASAQPVESAGAGGDPGDGRAEGSERAGAGDANTGNADPGGGAGDADGDGDAALGSDAAPEGPWMDGVSVDDQERARELFLAGNDRLRDAFPGDAAALYRQALAVWDHPAIHYNLAMAQRELDQLVDAHASLERAMRHGPAAFGGQKYEHAVRIQALLEEQLAHIEVICPDAGARVVVDGVVLAGDPGGRRGKWVRPGPHQVVASRSGHVPDPHSLELEPGERASITCRLRAEAGVEFRRRWWPGLPYVIAGSSAVLFAVGLPFDRSSSAGFAAFDRGHGDLCPTGCLDTQVSAALLAELDRARGRQNTARGFYAAGAALLVTGAVLWYLNRERAVRVTDPGDPGLVVAPYVGEKSGGVTAGVRFW